MGKLEKIPAWQLTRVRNKKGVIAEAGKEGKTVHFAFLMDVCHLKNSELEPEVQKYKVRVVLRGEIVKDDSGSHAVFTEQGSSASQMTAAKVMVIKSRLPGDAVSAHSQVKLKMHQRYSKFQSQNVQIFGYIYQSTNGQNYDPVCKIQSFLLNESCTVILWQDLWERQFEKLLNTVGKRFQIGNVYSLTEKKGYSCLRMWTI